MSYDDCGDCHNVLYWFGHHLVIIWLSFAHHAAIIWTSFGHHLAIIWSSFGHHLDMIRMSFVHPLGILWASFGYHAGMIWTWIGHHCEMIWNRKSGSTPPPSSKLIFPKPPKPQKIQTSTHRLLQRSAAEAAACKSGRGRRPSDSPQNSVPSFSRKPPWVGKAKP